MIAAVLRPAGLALRRAERRLLAEAPHRQSGLGDAEAFEILTDLHRTTIAEREVVLRRSAFIAMPLDADARLRPLLQPLRVSLQHHAALIANRVLVVIEEHVAERT